MFEFYTGQCYGHWVDKSYCPWFIEPLLSYLKSNSKVEIE